MPAPRSLRTAPRVGPLCPFTRVAVHVCSELTNGLTVALIPPIGLLRLAWQQLGSHLMVLCVAWLHTVPSVSAQPHRACPEHSDGRTSDGLRYQNEMLNL